MVSTILCAERRKARWGVGFVAVVGTAVAIALGAAAPEAPRDIVDPPSDPTISLVVGWTSLSLDAQAAARDHGLSYERSLATLDACVLSGPASQADEALAALRADARVRHASLNITFEVAGDCCDAGHDGDDAEWIAIEHQRLVATFGPIQARTRGNATTVVAVLDTGLDATRPDVAGAVLPGHSLLPGQPWDVDAHGHGTAMVSLIAGQEGVGPAGVAPGVRVLPVKVADAQGRATLADVAAGLTYAVDRGARVVLLSLGARLPAPILDEAIAYAEARGVLVVAAAGNRNTNMDLCPAADPRVLSVGCVDDAGRLATSTAFAPTTDLLAPGVDVAAALPRSGHASVSGTSVAAARVAAVAALARELAPGLEPAALRAVLKGSTRPLALFASDPDTRRVFRAGVLDTARLVAALDQPATRPVLSDPRVLPAGARAGDPVVCSVRLENRGQVSTGATQVAVTIAGVPVAQLDVPSLAPGAESVLRVRVNAPATGEVAFAQDSDRVTCTLAAQAAPVRDLAVAHLEASAQEDGGIVLRAVIEGRGAIPDSARVAASLVAVTTGALAEPVLLTAQDVTLLGAGDQVTLEWRVTPAQLAAVGADLFQARVLDAALDLEVPGPGARTQYQQNGRFNCVVDAPFRLAPGRIYVPVLVFVPEKGDLDANTWAELDRVTIHERSDPALNTAAGLGQLLYDDARLSTSVTAATGVTLLDEDGQPMRRGNGPDLRLLRHDRIVTPGRYNIVKLPRTAFGIPSVPTANEYRFLDVKVEWTNRRQFLIAFHRTHTGSTNTVLRVRFAATPRPQLPGGGHYLDAHVHTTAEWHQEDGFNLLAPRRNLGGPIPMVKEASYAIGLTDAVDAVNGRVVTTDHNAFYNQGDTVKDRPQFGPTSPGQAAGKDEFGIMRDTFGLTSGEEVTFTASNPFIGAVNVNLPTGAHMLTYRAQHIEGAWHGGSSFARAIGDPFPDNELEGFIRTLAKTNRGENRHAATFGAHPLSTSTGWADEHFEAAFERDPTRRTDNTVHAEQTGFVTKGLQVWNSDSTRHLLPTDQIDFDALNPWIDPDFQAGNPDWDSALNETLYQVHSDASQVLEYELDAQPGVRFPRKILMVAGNDAHGDFNFSTGRTATIITARATFSVKYRAYGKVATYAMADYQPPGAPPEERAFEAMLDGNSILTDGPLATVSIDAEDRFDGTTLQWHDASSTHEDADGRLGGGGDFDGLGTALVRRGSPNVRFGYRYTNTDEFRPNGTGIERIYVYRTSPGDPNPIVTKPSGSPWLQPRGELAATGPDQELEEALDPNGEGLVTQPSFFQIGAFTAADPATMDREERRCYTNPIWAVPFDATVTVASVAPAASGSVVSIPAGALQVTFEFDMSLDPRAYAVEIKALDTAGSSSDQTTGPIDVLVPQGGSNGWSDVGAVKNARYTVTNQRPIPLNLDRWPAGSDRVTYAVYFYDAPVDPFGNALNKVAVTFDEQGVGTGGGTGPAISRSGTVAPPATAQPSTGGGGGGSSGGGCAITSAPRAGNPWWALLLLGWLVALRVTRSPSRQA